MCAGVEKARERPDHQVVQQEQVPGPTIGPLVHEEEHLSFYQKQAEFGLQQQSPKSYIITHRHWNKKQFCHGEQKAISSWGINKG